MTNEKQTKTTGRKGSPGHKGKKTRGGDGGKSLPCS